MERFFEICSSSLLQTTISKPATVIGKAMRYFSGKSTVRFLPSEKQGLVFRVEDKNIRVTPSNVIFDKNHCTSLKFDSVVIRETEHVLSAVYGLGISNLVIEIEGSREPPIMDGSAKAFVDALLDAGIQELSDRRKEAYITQKFMFSLPGNERFIQIEPYEQFFLDLKVDFPLPIGKQQLSLLITPETYRREIAFARAPLRCPIKEVSLRQLRTWFKGYEESKGSIIHYSKEKYLTKLRAKNEVVRHKALDFIGDIANIGFPIKGKFVCYKIGHEINGKFVKLFRT